MTLFDELKATSAYLNRRRRELVEICAACGSPAIATLDGDSLCHAQAPEPECGCDKSESVAR